MQVDQIELEMQGEELQRAHAEAREAAEKYYDLFDFAPVGYFLWDHGARILEVNMAGAALLGLTRKAAVHKRFGQFLAVENRPAFAEFCKGVLATGYRRTCEVKLLRDGQSVDVLLEGIAAPGRQGQGKCCCVAVIDITQQKRADELGAANRALQSEIVARKQAEDELRTIAEFPQENPHPILRVSADGTVLYTNQPAARLLETMGWQAGQALPEDLLARRETSCRSAPARVRPLVSRGTHILFRGGAQQPAGPGQSLRARRHRAPTGGGSHAGERGATPLGAGRRTTGNLGPLPADRPSDLERRTLPHAGV